MSINWPTFYSKKMLYLFQIAQNLTALYIKMDPLDQFTPFKPFLCSFLKFLIEQIKRMSFSVSLKSTVTTKCLEKCLENGLKGANQTAWGAIFYLTPCIYNPCIGTNSVLKLNILEMRNFTREYILWVLFTWKYEFKTYPFSKS